MRTPLALQPSRIQRAAKGQASRIANEQRRQQLREEAVRLYESGLPMAEVAKILGKSATTVSRALLRSGVASRKPNTHPLARRRKNDLRTRLLARSIINFKTNCWEWSGAKDQWGYGLIKSGGVQCRAHRAIYEMWFGPVPDGLDVDHLCFVRNCINPDHLEAVTSAVNQQRRAARAQMLRNGQDPALTPILLHSEHGSGALVWLGADGSYLLAAPERSASWAS